MQNPTREVLERVVADLEHGKEAIAFASGMAAITAVLDLFEDGDHILYESDLYGGTIRLFNTIGVKNGLSFSELDFVDERIKQHLKPTTKALFLETPTNPMLRVLDIELCAKIAHENGLLLIVDNTLMSPYLQNPLHYGADIVIHSGTKYLCGHNDVMAGFLVTNDTALAERLRGILMTTGAVLPPIDSWLMLRGIQTLGVRMDRAQQNTIRLAEWLRGQKGVRAVHLPGSHSPEEEEAFQRQTRGIGAMLSFEVESVEMAKRILHGVRLIRFAESLGGTITLITYPVMQTHADIPKAQREATGVTDCLLRLSVEIEDAEDLIADLAQAIGGEAPDID